MMLTTRVLLTEDRLTQDFLAALERRELPEKYFYWFPTSVRAWLNLCSDGAYRNYVRSRELLQAQAAEIVVHLPAGDVTVVSLGAGQGTKDLLVLEQCRASGRRPYYVPVDASQSLLEMACGAATATGVPCHGVKADIADTSHLAAIGEASPADPRLVMMLGNTLGAFAPPEYARQLARLLRADDYLLLDGEIFSDTGTLAGYDNPLNRQFAFGPLRGVGLVEPGDGVLQFETSEDDQCPGLFRLRKHFLPARDLTLNVAGEIVRWRAGERVEMNWSCKYARETFLSLLVDAGLVAAAHYLSNDERFIMTLATGGLTANVRVPPALSSPRRPLMRLPIVTVCLFVSLAAALGEPLAPEASARQGVREGLCGSEDRAPSDVARQLEPLGESGRAALLGLAASRNPAEAICGVAGLSALGDRRVIPHLVAALQNPAMRDKANLLARWAAFLAGGSDSDLGPAMLTAVQAITDQAVWNAAGLDAIWFLGEVDHPAARDRLLVELDQPSSDAGLDAAIHALARHGDPRARGRIAAVGLQAAREKSGNATPEQARRLGAVAFYQLALGPETLAESLATLGTIAARDQEDAAAWAVHTLCERAARRPSEGAAIEAHRRALVEDLDRLGVSWHAARGNFGCGPRP